MRILIGCNRYFPDVAGGGNRVAFDAARFLVSKGNEVAFVCEGIPGKPLQERLDGVHVVRYSVPGYDLDYLSRHQRAAKRALQQALGGWRPDVLWGHMPLQMSAMMNAFPDAFMTYTVHSPVLEEAKLSQSNGGAGRMFSGAVKGRVLSYIEDRCCQAASVITVLSQFTRREIARLHGDQVAAKVRIVPGWADLSRFQPAASRDAIKQSLGWPLDHTVFFSVRRFFPRMGLDRLLGAAGMLRDQRLDFHLYLAGEGPLRADLESQIARLHLDDHVRLVGVLTEPQLAAMYSAADASVIPTRALECFGLIAVEAMSAGTPALSTPVGALPEIISPFEPKWLSRDNSAAAIADLLSAFIQKQVPEHSPAEIRSYVDQHYSQSQALPRFINAAFDGALSEMSAESRPQVK
jgi:glycosyltransferase involved in cell wall biosynthesis